MFLGRSSSFSSDDSNPHDSDKPLPPPVLVYHESARSIVFRDHLRRAHASISVEPSNGDNVEIINYQPKIKPLPSLQLTAKDEFSPLLDGVEQADLTEAEQEIITMFKNQMACVKTIKNSEWTAFLRRFSQPIRKHNSKYSNIHDDLAPSGEYVYNSFVTSTTLLPANGLKMRCFGSLKEYTVGAAFALPCSYGDETESEVVWRTKTWAWPSGYAAKTEFNIDGRGRLINGREEALVNLEEMRKNNHDYISKENYKILGRTVQGGLKTVPYNEVFLRVGGIGRLVDVVTKEEHYDGNCKGRSLTQGVGLPVALFVRSATYGHLIALLRTRARCAHAFGTEVMKDMPLILITPQDGVKVLTKKMEQELLKIAARDLNPFQNTSIAYKTTMENTCKEQLQQKMDELLDLDDDNIQQMLTPEERARIAGGFGATDESTVSLLMEAKRMDTAMDSVDGSKNLHTPQNHNGNHLQDIVNEGLACAVRSSDYHTARQLLILYSLVATQSKEIDSLKNSDESDSSAREELGITHIVDISDSKRRSFDTNKGNFCDAVVKRNERGELKQHTVPAPPPPPPLDTDRLRSATNSDGLLAVLGAAQVLRAMQDGGAKKRVYECISAIDEWVDHGQNSVAFRLSSWRDQLAAQADLKIAMEHDSSFMAFVSNKAITNRKQFARKLETAVSTGSFQGLEFLQAIHEIVSRMHSPCLRLELLQFVLGLDNRFSVAHLARSVELAISCLSMRATTTAQN
mmetsp:Transcript_12501/g.18351  ORF Transcript_12501/g.18351 Transcript_12501/m.18351 type:complete len:744 (-) Transcript_12501:117-2348(-)